MTSEELEFLTERKRAYQHTFKSPAGEAVIRDLVRYCCVKVTTKGDPMLEGRRQVFLRIQQHLELNPEDMFRVYEKIGDYDG
jgi:hypothetical protein